MRNANYLVVALLAFGYISAEVRQEPRDLITDIITNMLECARGLLEQGIPEIDFPSLNNLTIPSLNLTLNEYSSDFSGFLYVEDFEFAGLTKYVVQSVTGSIGIIPPSYTVNMALNFPRVIISTKYSANFQSPRDDLDIKGEGIMECDAYNFQTMIRTKAVILIGITLDYFEFWPSVEGLNSFTITGVNFDEEYSKEVSEHIKAEGSFIVADLSGRINEIVGSILMDMSDAGLLNSDSLIYHVFTKCL